VTKSSALADDKLSECIEHVHKNYLSKAFSAAEKHPNKQYGLLQCQIRDEIIHRPYSNVVHAARLAFYVPKVIEKLQDHHNNKKNSVPDPYKDLNVAQIQFTCLYLSVHKAHEEGWNDPLNKDGLQKSIEAFKKDERGQPFFQNAEGKVDQEAIDIVN
jgi:hypothetical protein